MRDYSGFRQEINPNSKLGKLLAKTALRFRKATEAKATSIVKRTVDQWMGDGSQSIYGTFSVQPKSQSISFQGGSTLGLKYEYSYGKLTIEHDGVYVPARKAVTMFTQFLNRVNAPFEFIETNSK